MPTTTATMVTHQTPIRVSVHAGPGLHRPRELNDRLGAAWTNTWDVRPVTVSTGHGFGGSALDLACALAALSWAALHDVEVPMTHERWVPSGDARKMTAWGELNLDGSVRGGVLSDGRQARVVAHLRDLPGLVRELAADQTWEG